ncbi:hypothetical protein [Nonomuraea recticatena]|uniref:hypothetical protein n=1 Tax=Nonomuraea recticatena TaxID=46178 RepID=UPI00360B425D
MEVAVGELGALPRGDLDDEDVGAQAAQQPRSVGLVLQGVGDDRRVRVGLAVGAVKARRLPSGDQTAGPAAAPVSARGSPPSMGSRCSCGLPSTGRRNASVRPSGDQRGARS